jgi:hypothetical protein
VGGSTKCPRSEVTRWDLLALQHIRLEARDAWPHRLIRRLPGLTARSTHPRASYVTLDVQVSAPLHNDDHGLARVDLLVRKSALMTGPRLNAAARH